MKKLSQLIEAIPGWLFLTITVGVIALFLDPIMGLLQKRVTQVEQDKLRGDAHTVCFRDDFSQSRQLQACLDGRELAKLDNKKQLELKYIERLCEINDASSCYELSQIKKKLLPKDDYKSLLNKACRQGRGGSMLACGKLGELIESDSPALSKKYQEYACASGHKKYCL
ncbi:MULTISPECIES: hypothetical protein [unclassified Halobacteriovorax]|uniref:hypothetical protein n=1 Tax=unclassified Halobacteriovorax TaxID=2639665 RepID=UPI0039996F4B